MNLDVAPDFAGVVSVSRGDKVEFEHAYGLADCAHGITATVDTQVSFRSLHDPERELTATVVANTTDGAWPVARQLVTLPCSGATC
ncbi:MAG TPA: hypothetical protein VFE19_01975 [Jatrophihabitantaceae bacterium]|nr:hypothetical protein [Jatrophihabitantaceae bacterium]